jgi:hypothetical protein
MNSSARCEATISEQVAKAFRGSPTAQSDDFLRELRVNWREASSRARRDGLLLVLLYALFVLLIDAKVSEVAIAGVRLSPGSIELIATALPAITAAVFTQHLELRLFTSVYYHLHYEMCRQLYPALDPLSQALHPPDTNDFGLYKLLTLERSTQGQRLMVSTGNIGGLTVIFLPFLFVPAAYIALPVFTTPNPVFLAVSLLLGTFFMIRATGLFLVAIDPDGYPLRSDGPGIDP